MINICKVPFEFIYGGPSKVNIIVNLFICLKEELSFKEKTDER